jgi:hypothetical protein
MTLLHYLVIGCIIPGINLPVISGMTPEKECMVILPGETFHISGKITDVASGIPVQDAKITILDADTRAVICGEIYTDAEGSYDQTIDIDVTGLDSQQPALPASYALVQSYPNPISAAVDNHLTILYSVPLNRREIPAVRMVHILGSEVRPDGYLPAGIYFCRLGFEDGHRTGSEKIVVTSGGTLIISPVQVFERYGITSTNHSTLKNAPEQSVRVLFMIEKSGYIHTERIKELAAGIDNVHNFTLVEEGQKSSASIDSTGGVIAVANDRGDSIKLVIPRYALWDATEISLTVMNTQPENPISRNIFPGVSITPGGLKLLHPAILQVVFATASPDTNSASLFSIRQSDLVLPIGNQAVTDSSISGDIRHFSEFAAGEPSADEAGPQADGAGGMGGSDPYGWEDTWDCVDALLWWAEFYSRNGMTGEGQKCFDDAKEIVEHDAGDFLDMPVPDDPCGEYLTTLMKFAELVMKVVGGELESRIQDRVIEIVNRCNLRGEIEYDHHVICTDGDHSTDTRIVGWIPFYVNTLVEPYNTITGGGTAKATIHGPQAECYMSGSGTHRVNNISGELNVDQQGIAWLEMTLDETWWETSTIYVTCPDPDNNGAFQMPSVRFPTQVRFLVADGYKFTLPDFDCAGSYNYILHIIHQP